MQMGYAYTFSPHEDQRIDCEHWTGKFIDAYGNDIQQYTAFYTHILRNIQSKTAPNPLIM